MQQQFDESVVSKVIEMMNGKNELYLEDIVFASKIKLGERSELAKRGYIIKHNENKIAKHIFRKDMLEVVKPVMRERRKLEYIVPHFFEELKVLFQCAKDWTNNRSVNVRFIGPHGSGKSEFAYIIAKESGFDKVERINGHSEMCSSDFLGEKTVSIDPASGSSIVKYQKGTLEKAMTHGLKKDSEGNVVFDSEGNVIIEGSPALLFIDEYAAIPPHLSIVLNRVLEIPAEGKSRGIEIASDVNRAVKSHPGFAIILSGNTAGKGCESSKSAGYTAQDYQQDDSTLDRITATYEFGYNLNAERMYLEDAIDDEIQVSQMIKFIEDIRKEKISENVLTLLSTRGIVAICQLVKSFRKAGMKNALMTAIYRTVYNGLREVERDAWAEKLNIYFNYDIRQIGKKDKSIFYV